jgi:hypothetical protein
MPKSPPQATANAGPSESPAYASLVGACLSTFASRSRMPVVPAAPSCHLWSCPVSSALPPHTCRRSPLTRLATVVAPPLPPLASPLPAQSEDLRKICEHTDDFRLVPRRAVTVAPRRAAPRREDNEKTVTSCGEAEKRKRSQRLPLGGRQGRPLRLSFRVPFALPPDHELELGSSSGSRRACLSWALNIDSCANAHLIAV